MRRSVVTFFLLAFAITWTLQLPAVLVTRGVLAGPVERFMLPMGLGAFGPAIAAVLAARMEGGREGVSALLASLTRWRVSPWWYLIAAGASGALLVAGMAVYSLVSGRHDEPWLYLPNEAARFVAMFVFPVGEEIGWRGFALPRLQARYGALIASAIIGALWCLWHAAMFAVSGISLSVLFELLPFFIAGSVVFAWIYNRTGASLLLAVIAHAGAHLNNSNRPLPANATPALVHTAAFCVAAIALAILDPKTLRTPRAATGMLHAPEGLHP